MGVIGTGGISRVHIEGTVASPDAELAALCDIREEALNARGDLYGVDKARRFIRYRDLIECPEIDAVAVCTSNDAHYEIAKCAILNRKPFLLEKPATLDYGQSLELERLALEYGVPNMIAFSYRFKSAARYARELVRKGALGKILHVYGQYFQAWAIGEELPLVWRFRKAKAGSGTLGDLGSHLIDLGRFMVGEYKAVCGDAGTFVTRRKLEGSEEYGDVDVDDYCHVLARMDGGVGAVFSVTRDAYARGNYQRIEIYGTQGALVYKLDEEGTHEDVLEICIGEVYAKSRKFHRVQIPESCRADQTQSFFNIVNGRGDGLPADITDGRINQMILDSIIKSFETGQWIKLKEEN